MLSDREHLQSEFMLCVRENFTLAPKSCPIWFQGAYANIYYTSLHCPTHQISLYCHSLPFIRCWLLDRYLGQIWKRKLHFLSVLPFLMAVSLFQLQNQAPLMPLDPGLRPIYFYFDYMWLSISLTNYWEWLGFSYSKVIKASSDSCWWDFACSPSLFTC